MYSCIRFRHNYARLAFQLLTIELFDCENNIMSNVWEITGMRTESLQ